MLNERRQSQKEKYYTIPFMRNLGQSNSVRETESETVAAKGWGQGEWELFNEDRVSVGEDEKSSGAGWWRQLHNSVNVQRPKDARMSTSASHYDNWPNLLASPTL